MNIVIKSENYFVTIDLTLQKKRQKQFYDQLSSWELRSCISGRNRKFFNLKIFQLERTERITFYFLISCSSILIYHVACWIISLEVAS